MTRSFSWSQCLRTALVMTAVDHSLPPYEVKTVQYSTSSSGSWYRSRQMRAVDQRALRVLPERFRDARRVDDLLFPLHPQGPVLHRLHALGGVEPLVVGAFGERNQRAHRLVSQLAEAAGPRVQRESAVDAQSAKGLAVWHLKRVLGCCLSLAGAAWHNSSENALTGSSSPARTSLAQSARGQRTPALSNRPTACWPRRLPATASVPEPLLYRGEAGTEGAGGVGGGGY